ncbi:MAG: polyprenyl synthetase family protein [Candidatus Helarchaeota archaeon]
MKLEELKNFKELLATEGQTINFEIASFFNDYLVIDVDPFVLQFYSSLKRFIMSGGKRLRPVSLVQTYKGLTTNENLDIYKLSLCTEFLHNASLAHDDIIDHDDVRRGQPTLHIGFVDWLKYNLPKAPNPEDFGLCMGILGGDSLIQLGIKAIQNTTFDTELKNRAIQYYIRAYEELINGVVFESYLQVQPIDEITIDDYLKMAAGKTSALFEKSMLIGGLMADPEEKYKHDISEFAISLGQAFQIRDDILGVFGQEKKLGKPVYSDIREGKKTLLVIFSAEEEKVKEIYGKKDISLEEAETVKKIMEDTGALEQTAEIARDLSEVARDCLSRIPFSSGPKKFFQDLIDFVQERKY